MLYTQKVTGSIPVETTLLISKKVNFLESKKLVSSGLEPETFRVLSGRDNLYTTELASNGLDDHASKFSIFTKLNTIISIVGYKIQPQKE